MRLVTTLLAADPEALRRQAKAAGTPWVEVRLDAFREATPALVGEARKAVKAKAIATCRAQREGGLFRGSEGERHDLLTAALDAGFEAIDVEADAHFRDDLLARARRAGAEAILSRHDLRPARHARGAADFLDQVPLDCVAKYAAAVEGPEDLAALVWMASLARDRGLRHAVMGLGDASLRLLAPALGSELVYCAPPEGAPAAPGQLPAEAVARVHALLPQPPRIGPRHRLVALLGDPVGHSRSPALQNAAFAAGDDPLAYVAIPTPPARLKAVLAGLRAAGFAGANVTTPLKEAVLRHADQVHKAAGEARSANTLVARRGKVAAHTTDGPGALAALREAGAPVKGQVALVLGAGATGRSVAHALARAGARVLVANRTPAKAKALARAAGAEAIPWKPAAFQTVVPRSDLLVHCTPHGAEGKDSPVPAALLGPRHLVLDAVYRPGRTTRLVQDARARGARALPGETLLLHQGALAYKLWTGKPAPLGPMRAALAQEAP